MRRFVQSKCQWWLLVLLCLLAAVAEAQAPAPTGDGLRGQYYDGEHFERLMLVRRDPTVDFDWGLGEPAPGLPTERFSVRWLGWLVVPTSGIYRFRMSVDDGMRVWLNDRVLLNEWRPQRLQYYTISIALQAGVAYRLRVDYYQNIVDTRALVAWLPPNAPGRFSPIPTRYLFTEKPKLPSENRPVAAAAKPAATAEPRPAAGPAVAPRRAAEPPSRPALPRPEPIAPPPVVVAAPVSSAAERVATLAEGQEVTLPELYFDQGRAQLLPAARAGLDSLARALAARPALRLEVQGHTDNVGSAELNRQLSQQRAEVVCLYLAAHGVAAGRLRPVGYGGAQPVADNANPAQRPRNRRVVLRRL